MSDKKIIVVGGAQCSPFSAQVADYLGACPATMSIKPDFKSSRRQRESAKTAKRFIDPMHGTLSRIVRVPDGKGGTKLMKMKTAIKKGFIKVK